MAEQRRVKQTSYSYIGDSLARQAEPVREHRPVTKEEIQIRRNRERSRSMSPAFVVAMTLVIGITFAICLNYLSIQNEVNRTMRSIASLENTYDTLKKENEALDLSISAYQDYAYIYDVAVNELGMRPAGKDQIVTFDLEESEYVKQYEAIPEH